MKIDRFNLFLLMSVILGVEAGFFDAFRSPLLVKSVGMGPEGIIALLALRLIGWFLFKED